MKQEKNIRRAAVSALRAWSKGHHYADTLVERHAIRNHLSPQDRGLLNAIILGVLRNRTVIDHWIGEFRHGKLDPETRDILRVGICQIVVLQLPDHAAVNETVECARAPIRGLINAVLRKVAHARARLIRQWPELDPPLRFSHPQWLWKKWRKEFGPANATALMEWNNQPAEIFLRSNPLNPPPEPVLAPYQPVLGSELPHDLIQAGHYYITDPSTAESIRLLDPKPGEAILDACAAPGGKAAHLAALMENQGTLVCTDSNPKRLPRLKENLTRLGVTIAEISEHDWCLPAPEKWQGNFDAILLDVPCSNTGVLRRRVDARWRLQPAQIEELVTLQRTILENALPCLKPGGRLVYSTCSIEKAENSGQIRDFLKAHPGLKLERETQLLPFKNNTDGAYAARLSR